MLTSLASVPAALGSNLPQSKAALEHPVSQVVEAPIESRREGSSRMTWKLQHLVLPNGSSIVTLAGLQFEEALGLSVVILEPPPSELFLSKTDESQKPKDQSAAQGRFQPAKKFDIPFSSEKRLPGEPARAEIQLKNLVVEFNDLNNPENSKLALKDLPACDKGRRKAIAFIRAEQASRQLEMNPLRAIELSRYGRAACVGWDDFPPEAKLQPRNSSQTEIPAL